MCKDMTEALLENVIEITWMFDSLEHSREIKSWDDLIDEFYGSNGIKAEIIAIAKEFEEKSPFDTTWENGDLDYLEEIEKFARKRLIEIFGKKKSYYVSFKGSVIVEASNEDEACELAADQISLDEINAYEMDENGEIIGLK